MKTTTILAAALLSAAATAAHAAETITYRYDAKARLITVDRRSGGGTGVFSRYVHDRAANRRRVTTGAHKGATLMPGAQLLPGEAALSADGRFLLVLQHDGNLILYDGGMTPLWASQTAGSAATNATMQSDGNFVVYRGTTALFATGTQGNPGARLVVQNDGNVVVYSSADQPLWFTNTCCR